MTRQDLEDYRYICLRIERMEAVCADTVMGSMEDFPYTKHTVSIRGVQHSAGREDEMVLMELQAKRREIEAWVAALPTEREKTLVELHALRGLRWTELFRKAGYRSPDSARMAYKNILMKFL